MAIGDVNTPTSKIESNKANELATAKSLEIASNVWGPAALKGISIPKNDIYSAAIIAAFGPGTFASLGHKAAHGLGEQLYQFTKPILEFQKRMSTPPDSIANIPPSSELDAKFIDAGQFVIKRCNLAYGEEAVKDCHIDKKDWGASVGLYLLGPGGYKLYGHDFAAALGKRVVVYGYVPAIGLFEEAREQLTKHLADTTCEGGTYAVTGMGLGVLNKFSPHAAIAIGAASTIGVANEQLFAEKNRARNLNWCRFADSLDNLNNTALVAGSMQYAKPLGNGAWHLGLATLIGGVAFKGGEKVYGTTFGARSSRAPIALDTTKANGTSINLQTKESLSLPAVKSVKTVHATPVAKPDLLTDDLGQQAAAAYFDAINQLRSRQEALGPKFTFRNARLEQSPNRFLLTQEQVKSTHTANKEAMSRLGNYRYKERTIEQFDDLTQTAKTVTDTHRIYSIPGHDTKIVIMNDYAQELDRQRNMMLRTYGLHSAYKPLEYTAQDITPRDIKQKPISRQDRDLFLTTGWRAFPDGTQTATVMEKTATVRPRRTSFVAKPSGHAAELARPEHLAAELASLPNPALVKEIELCNYYYPRENKGLSPDSIAAVADYYPQAMRFFRSKNNEWLTETSKHEFSHLMDDHRNTWDYATAVKLEKGLSWDGFNLSSYGETDVAENYAVQGEGLLSPDGKQFAKALDPRAYLRTAVFAKQLGETLNEPGAKLSLHQGDYLKRVDYIEHNITPLAVEKLKSNIIKSQGLDQNSLSLLGYLGKPKDAQYLVDLASHAYPDPYLAQDLIIAGLILNKGQADKQLGYVNSLVESVYKNPINTEIDKLKFSRACLKRLGIEWAHDRIPSETYSKCCEGVKQIQQKHENYATPVAKLTLRATDLGQTAAAELIDAINSCKKYWQILKPQ